MPDSHGTVAHARATVLGGGRVCVQCDPVACSDYYRVWIQAAGTEADFRLADSPAEPDKIIEGLTVGATARLKMRAVNETGPEAFGESVPIVVG